MFKRDISNLNYKNILILKKRKFRHFRVRNPLKRDNYLHVNPHPTSSCHLYCTPHWLFCYFTASVTNECDIPELNLCEDGCTDTDISFFCTCSDPTETLASDGYECIS